MTLIFEVKNLVNCMSTNAILCDLLELFSECETNNKPIKRQDMSRNINNIHNKYI